ncbi:MAG: FtsX-like permease family protein [Salinivirgaceae bacterium]|jgi:putative ABC transport system permease protein|nr:FtsX-like permease family protein [Salinivirgaceae bacterium]
MFTFNHFKSFANHLWKNKRYTIITVLGFSISVMFVIVLSLHIERELSIDAFHSKKDRIYRLANDMHSVFSPPMSAMLVDHFPQFEASIRTYSYSGILSAQENVKLSGEVLLADSAFFRMFSYPLIKGNIETVLSTTNSLVLTETLAYKLLGENTELGTAIVLDGKSFILQGIMKDFPENTIFANYEAVANFTSLEMLWDSQGLMASFDNNSFGIYLLAVPNADMSGLSEKTLEYFHTSKIWLYTRGYVKTVAYEPITDVYFSNRGSLGIKAGNRQLIAILFGVTLLILVLSIINYINLTIAQAGFRSKEVAIRKLNGSSRLNLIFQLLSESVLLCVVAFGLAFLLANFVEPLFNQLLSANVDISMQFQFYHWGIGVLLMIIIGAISGIVPALYITRINPIEIINGSFRLKTKARYSKVLIAFQLIIVIVLLSGTVSIFRQFKYMQQYDLGFNYSNVLLLDNQLDASQCTAFRNEAERIPGVSAVAYVAGTPIDGGNNNSFNYKDKSVGFQVFTVDTAFMKMMNFRITPTGVAYSPDGVYINRAAIRELELDSLPLKCPFYSRELDVLGVVDDFVYRSLYSKIGSTIIKIRRNESPWQIAIGLQPNATTQTYSQLGELYKHVSNGIPFEYQSMDESVEQWFDAERNTAGIMLSFSILSIIISIMGIYAMSLYFIQQKHKEIAMRKIVGAEVNEVVTLLSSTYIKIVIVAFVIATPISMYGVAQWLEQFPYRTDLAYWVFGFAGVVTLLISVTTVASQVWHAARKNPVRSLRYE